MFWGVIFPVQVPKIGYMMWGTHPLLRGELRMCGLPPHCGSLSWKEGCWQDCLCLSFHLSVALSSSVQRSLPVFYSITSLSLYSSHFFSSITLIFGVPGMGQPCSWDTWLFSLLVQVFISDVGIPDCLGSFRSFPAKSQWNLPWLPNLQFQPTSKMSYPLFFLLSF